VGDHEAEQEREREGGERPRQIDRGAIARAPDERSVRIAPAELIRP
jgi:hypothetical protein